MKPTVTSNANETLLESILSNEHVQVGLTVTSNVDLSQINMPRPIKTFGRPSRSYLTTTTGFGRRKNVVNRFDDRPDKEKIHDMMN